MEGGREEAVLCQDEKQKSPLKIRCHAWLWEGPPADWAGHPQLNLCGRHVVQGAVTPGQQGWAGL